MSAYFVDTSALIKRYVRETGSDWVRAWSAPDANNLIILSDVVVVELLSVLARRRRARVLSASTISRLRQAFTAHLQQGYFLVSADQLVYDRAGNIAFDRGLKALDALQLGSALRARDTLQEPIMFVSGDAELLAAAAAEGFAVDNPLNHP